MKRETKILRLAGSACALAVLLTVTAFHAAVAQGYGQDRQWGFGTEIGGITDTVDGTVFAMGFNPDYYLHPAFSFGPLIYITPVGDLTEIFVAGVARFHIRLEGLNVVPFTGLGFAYANLERGGGFGAVDETDSSHYIPLGIAIERMVSWNIVVTGGVVVNLHNFDLGPGFERDQTSLGVMVGVRFEP